MLANIFDGLGFKGFLPAGYLSDFITLLPAKTCLLLFVFPKISTWFSKKCMPFIHNTPLLL